MKIDDKVKLLSGKDVWHTANIDSEQIPSIMMSDGPHGIRKQYDSQDNLGQNETYQATLFPAAVTLACTFNENLAEKAGDAIGKEARLMDVQVVLGPGINIKRSPLCGRNFEYYSEDPYLAGIMGKKWIEGLQKKGVGASLKHFAANSQERLRMTIDSVVDERALREIYLKNFQIALKANPATVMCSYNKLNGTLASESKYLLTDVLRNEWNYEGMVVSDWSAVSDRVKGVINGLDLEMPSSQGYNNEKVLEAYRDGQISEAVIDKAVNRVLALVYKYKDNKVLPYDLEESHKVSQEIAREGIVLLKNEDVLPLKANEKIALIGGFAKKPRVQGGGSSNVNPYRVENVYDEIKGYTSNYQYFEGYSNIKDGYDEALLKEVLDNIKDFDKVIVMTGLPENYESEGSDRQDIDLPTGHLHLIDEILKINPNVVITLFAGSQVAMPFSNKVKAILNCNLLGAASGRPILDILYGVESPSGRLATTYPLRIEDDPTTKNFANTNNAIWYTESIFVGYRYYNTFKKPVLFPFGFGLSYSEFLYSDLEVDREDISLDHKIKVSVNVKNIGKYPAKEVVQLYVENNESSVYKPRRELRRFSKVFLGVGEEKTVEFTLNYEDFSYYDVNLNKFHVNKGTYKIQICKNVEEVLLEKEILRKENLNGYVEHSKTTYNLTDQDFKDIYNQLLPERNIVRKRPYTLDDNLRDVEKTLIGKVFKRFVIKEVKKKAKDQEEFTWMMNMVSETPFRSIAINSGGKIPLKKMEGIVDIINMKFFKGFKKI